MDGYFRFRCPHCSKRLKCLPSHAGRMTSCSDCGHRVQIPGPPERAAEGQSAPRDGEAGAPPPTAERPSRPPGRFQFECPECGGKLAVRESAVGKRIACPRCREPVVVPDPLPDDHGGPEPRPRRFPLGWVGLGVALVGVLLAGVALADRVPAGFAAAIEIAAAVSGAAGLAVSLVGVLTRRGRIGGWIGVVCGSLLVCAALLVGVTRGRNPPRVDYWYTTTEPLAGSSQGDSYRLIQPADRKLVYVAVKVYLPARSLYRKREGSESFQYEYKATDLQLVAANGESVPATFTGGTGWFAFSSSSTDSPSDGWHEFAFIVDERLLADGPLRLVCRDTPACVLTPQRQIPAPAR